MVSTASRRWHELMAYRLADIHLQAVIGAGAAGLVAARELAREGHQPTVFEQGSRPGGVWVYTDDVEEASMPGGDTHAHCMLVLSSSASQHGARLRQPLDLHRCHSRAQHARHAADAPSSTTGPKGCTLS